MKILKSFIATGTLAIYSHYATDDECLKSCPLIIDNALESCFQRENEVSNLYFDSNKVEYMNNYLKATKLHVIMCFLF